MIAMSNPEFQQAEQNRRHRRQAGIFSETTVTYHDHLDAEIRTLASEKRSPSEIAQYFHDMRYFPMNVSFVKDRLKIIPEDGLEAYLSNLPEECQGELRAYSLKLYHEDVERVFGAASRSNTETQDRRPLAWNMHVDVFVSEIDADDEGIKAKLEEVCGFLMTPMDDWLKDRLRDIAPASLKWVSENGPRNEDLIKRIKARMGGERNGHGRECWADEFVRRWCGQ